MKRLGFILVALMLASCREQPAPKPPSKSAEEVRIENEVKRRVAAKGIELDLEAKKARLRTIRITAFVVLCGGSIVCLIRLHPSRRAGHHLPAPLWTDHYPPGTRRALDLSNTPDPPVRAPRHRPTRHNHETPRRS